jgi:hypothetical protein
MRNQETGSIRRHVDNLLRMEGAHIAFDDGVADFPRAMRGAKPAGAPHSAWELLEHMRLAQEDILDFCRNPEYKDRTFPNDYWPPTEAPATDEDWENAVQQFQRDLTEMRALVADAAIDLLARIPHGQGQTVLQQALLVADHNAYHLGQLVFLGKMMEAQAAGNPTIVSGQR